jgi:hypothetical protein
MKIRFIFFLVVISMYCTNTLSSQNTGSSISSASEHQLKIKSDTEKKNPCIKLLDDINFELGQVAFFNAGFNKPQYRIQSLKNAYKAQALALNLETFLSNNSNIELLQNMSEQDIQDLKDIATKLETAKTNVLKSLSRIQARLELLPEESECEDSDALMTTLYDTFKPLVEHGLLSDLN